MKKFLLIILNVLLISSGLYAQISNYVLSVRTGDAKEKNPLSINADLVNVEVISQISIVYKSFGESDYKKIEMLIAGTSASGVIPAEFVQPPYIEYYILVELKDGSRNTYPSGVEEGVNPLQISISGESEKDKEILILSPLAGEIFSDSDQLITISFVRAPNNVDVSKTKILLNGIDVTQSALFTDDLIILSGENLPQNFPSGSRALEVQIYNNAGELYHTLNRTFQVVSEMIAKSLESQWKYNGYLKAEARNENSNSVQTWYNNIGGEFNSSVSDWNLNAYAYITSEEKKSLQPYNRFSVAIQNGEWLDLKAGDTYPRFPNLIMDGKRVRGFSGAINLGFFNVQASYGETDRSIEGKLLETYTANNVPLGGDVISLNESKYHAPFGRVEFGTFGRKLFALRPSFGSGENFQFGLTYLHSIDDKASIEFGSRPKENVVVGSDLTLAFDEKNVLLTSQAAISFINNDISPGTLTDAQIDSIFTSNQDLSVDPADVKKIRDYVDKFITVNQYLGPWNPQKLASLGAESALNLNYLNNNVRASYIYRGNDYQSFGQSFLRTDVKGINIVDRIRMMDNKLFLSLGYEKLQDNLQKTKISTTDYQTLSASISYFPRMNFPNITIGYNKFKNKNEISVKDSVNSIYAVDDITNKFLVQLSYDFTAYIRHSTSLSFTTSTREDNGGTNSDSKFTNVSLNVNSTWFSNLNSVFGIIYSTSEIRTKPFDYVTLTAGGRYLLLDNKLILSAILSPSFGDFERQSLELIANYNVLSNLNLAFQTRIYRIPGKTTNSIIGLSTRLII